MIQRKVIYAGHGPSASFDFIQHISPCVDILRHIVQSVESEFTLRRRSGKHKAPKIQQDLAALGTVLAEGTVHKFTPGRSTKNKDKVHNVFEMGVQDVPAKLQDFHRRMNSSNPEVIPDADSDLLHPPSSFDETSGSSGAEFMIHEFADCHSDDEDGDDFSNAFDFIF